MNGYYSIENWLLLHFSRDLGYVDASFKICAYNNKESTKHAKFSAVLRYRVNTDYKASQINLTPSVELRGKGHLDRKLSILSCQDGYS